MAAPLSRRSLLAGLPALLVGVAARPGFGVAAPDPKTTVSALNNGARVVVVEAPDAPVTALSVLFDVGVGDEVSGDQGITALLARSWISGVEGLTPALLRFDLAASGSAAGAWASGDMVELWAVARPDPFSVDDAARTLLMSLLSVPTFPEEAVEAAKAAQARALLDAGEDPVARLLSALRGRAFAGSAASRNPLGTPQTLRSLTAEAVRRHYRRCFNDPARTIFVVAGREPADDAKRLIEAHVNAGGWPRRFPGAAAAAARPEATSPPEQIPAGLRDVNLGARSAAPLLGVGYLAPGTASGSPADWAALLVLDTLVAGGKGSRLFALRDRPDPAGPLRGRPLGYDVRSVLEPGRRQSFWAAYVEGVSEGVSVTDAKAALLAEFAALATGARPPSEAEIARAKALLTGKHLRERQRLKDRAYHAGRAEMLGLGAAFDAEFATHIAAVTPADLARAARSVFGGNPVGAYTEPG